MGIYNRDYLRDDEGFDAYSPSGSQRSTTSIVVKLIIATAAVFVLQIMTARPQVASLVQSWLSLDSTTVFREGQIWRLLTYAFCHDQQNLLHIVFNMYLLYILGKIVCGLMGDREFLWFYCASAIFAGICSVAFYTFVGKPTSIIGASGAVMAVFMLFAMHYPRQRLYMFGIIPIEVRWLLAMYIVFDAYPVIITLMGNDRNPSMVAHSAHLGGLLFGFLYFRWNMRITNWWDRFAGRVSSMRRKKNNLRVFNPGTQPEAGNLVDSVDEILAKISREGEASLTPRERNILTQASRQIRRDRG